MPEFVYIVEGMDITGHLSLYIAKYRVTRETPKCWYYMDASRECRALMSATKVFTDEDEATAYILQRVKQHEEKTLRFLDALDDYEVKVRDMAPDRVRASGPIEL